jgi:hypothetical protein
MDSKIKIRDVIYIILIVASALSSHFITMGSVNTRLSLTERDIVWIKDNVDKIQKDVGEIKTIVLSIGN